MSKFNRRDVMGALLAISATGALSACKDTSAAAPKAQDDGAKFAAPGQFFSKRELAQLSVLADIIIPATDTPGALAAGVPDTIQNLMSDWATDDIRRDWRAGLSAVQSKLTQISGKVFSASNAADKFAAVKALDDLAFAEASDPADAQVLASYKDMKSTIATAYYMSEIGASEELRYEAVPGEWKGCVPFSDVGRTWAT